MSYRDTVLVDNPVSYWRLGEASGTSLPQDEKAANHATSVVGGAAASGLLTGDPNGARSFPGADYVTVASSASLGLGDVFTHEFWVKHTSLATSYLLTYQSGGGPGIRWLATAGRFSLRQGGATDVSTHLIIFTPVEDTTYHFVVTKDGPTVRAWIDGVEMPVSVTTATTYPNGTNFFMGARSGGTEVMTGDLDEVAIYNTVLSAARIRTHYMVGAAARETENVYVPMRKVA